MSPEQEQRIKARLRELAPNVSPELIEAPFNLSGETIDNSVTPEGEARVRALAEREARKAQRTFDEIETVRCPDHRNGGATRCPRGGAALQIWQRKQWGD